MNKILKALMRNKKEVNTMINGLKLGDPVMIIQPSELSADRQIDLTGIVVDIQGDNALVIWDVPGLTLESIVPSERLIAIVN